MTFTIFFLPENLRSVNAFCFVDVSVNMFPFFCNGEKEWLVSVLV